MQLQRRAKFRGCRHSVMFRLPYLLDPQVAPTVSLNVIGSRAVYTTHSSVGYLPREVASLRVRHEQLTRLDFHQLEHGLVGRSRSLFALLPPDTLYRPSLALCLPHSTSAGLVEGRDIPPQRRDFAIHGWISFYRLLTQGSMWTSQVPKLPP
jgi:hypothetical protein